MKVQVFHLFFKADSYGGLVPMDEHLYNLATNYAEEFIVPEVDFRHYKNTWVACEVDGEGKPERVLGVLCMLLRADFPICRFTDNAAVVKLVQRANDHLHDTYGARGTDVLVHIAKDEAPDQKCPNQQEWMQAFGMTPADRWLYRIR